jgi:uncharacterized membrane protein YkvA (DUF1232 family)
MGISEDDARKVRKSFEDNIKDVDKNDIEYASKKGNSKINDFGNNPPSSLLKVWNDIKLMISLITDYTKGNYKDVPWNVIAAVTVAVIYFISPIDVIPDFIPVVGYLDDLAVLKLALEFANDDLIAYKEWKNS